jgi:hypothetical protein
MLDEYARNLEQSRSGAARGALPVFISQPTLWAAQVPPELDALFCGAIGGPPSAAGAVLFAPGA